MDEKISAVTRHPRLTERDAYHHWSREQVRWSDTDLVGHVNNLSFAAYCETGRCMFLRPFVENNSSQRAMMLPAQLILNFIAEAHWPQVIEIGTGIISIGNTSCRIGQGLFVEGRCIATSEVTNVMIDEQTRQPRPLPDWFRSWLSEYMIG
ncbi:TPA: acyl-CoA thioesterase [Pseudomonas aeruginosa]|nr:acyl-CoA thioesterase [Pseudomonas aeruginosa]HEJ3161389.1 acyl-CoA thioesterase [Pseudomonas aeruginosa]